jgi:hypothetical protein
MKQEGEVTELCYVNEAEFNRKEIMRIQNTWSLWPYHPERARSGQNTWKDQIEESTALLKAC